MGSLVVDIIYRICWLNICNALVDWHKYTVYFEDILEIQGVSTGSTRSYPKFIDVSGKTLVLGLKIEVNFVCLA